jgi:hypothetical protein
MHAAIDRHEWADRSEMLSWNLAGDEFAVLFRVRADPDAYEAALADVQSVVDYEVVPAGPRTLYLFVRERPAESDLRFKAAFAETGLVVVPPLTYGPEGRMSFGVLGDASELSVAFDALPEEVETEVTHISEYDGGPGVLAGTSLTDRQREVLTVAAEKGYYEVPREAGVETVAAELDCAKSTAAAHLRKAEASLVDAYLDG